MNSNVTKLKPNTRYYAKIGQDIEDLGYNKPVNDTDPRQQEIWDILSNGGWSMEIERGYDCSNLAPHTHELFQYGQTRSNCEEDIHEYYEEFYLRNERQERIIFGCMIDNEAFISVGNRRIRAHEKGINEGYESKADVVWFSMEGATKLELLKMINRLARTGNRQLKQTRDETASDYVHQLNIAWKLAVMEMPELELLSDAQRIEWGRAWVIKEIDNKYAHESMVSKLGDIVNAVFAKHRGNSLPMPTDAQIAKKWSGFWPNSSWMPTSEKIIHLKTSSREDQVKLQLFTKWENREVFTQRRQTCHLVMRCGRTLGTEITSSEYVTKARKSALKQLAKLNTNVNYDNSGFPIVRKVMFIQQMNIGEYEAYEWNEETEEFVQVTAP